eukprot:4059581-Amphidinium_carterae.1
MAPNFLLKAGHDREVAAFVDVEAASNSAAIQILGVTLLYACVSVRVSVACAHETEIRQAVWGKSWLTCGAL